MEKWLKWAIEIQSLAQAGLEYTNNVYDIERYERLREISAEMIAEKTDLNIDKVKNLFGLLPVSPRKKKKSCRDSSRVPTGHGLQISPKSVLFLFCPAIKAPQASRVTTRRMQTLLAARHQQRRFPHPSVSVPHRKPHEMFAYKELPTTLQYPK